MAHTCSGSSLKALSTKRTDGTVQTVGRDVPEVDPWLFLQTVLCHYAWSRFLFSVTPLLPHVPYLFYDIAGPSSCINLICSILEWTILWRENLRWNIHFDSVKLGEINHILICSLLICIYIFQRRNFSLIICEPKWKKTSSQKSDPKSQQIYKFKIWTMSVPLPSSRGI